MSTYYQCENCGRSFHSSTDPYCWECRSVAADATFAGGSVANAATFAGVLSFICKAVLAWVGLMILFFAIAGYLLIASIVPLAFSITSIYLTAPLSGSGFPDIPSAVLPALAIVFLWTLLRMLVFVYGRGRKGLAFILGYFLLALAAGLVLTYTGVRPFALDMPQAAAEIAAGIQENAINIADDLQGNYQMLAPTIRGASELVAGLDAGLFSVSVVVYCCIFLLETVLFVRLMNRRSKKTIDRLNSSQSPLRPPI